MNTISKTIALAFALAATAASAELYYGVVNTDSYAAKDPEGSKANATRYAGYLCTAESAASLFAGKTDAGGVTDYLSGHYVRALADLIDAAGTEDSGVSALGTVMYVTGAYELSQYFDARLTGAYLAVVTYANDDDNAFRVFSSTADADGYVTFDPTLSSGGGTAGSWTAVIPEPTGGVLLLLGMAGLALKRLRAQ